MQLRDLNTGNLFTIRYCIGTVRVVPVVSARSGRVVPTRDAQDPRETSVSTSIRVLPWRHSPEMARYVHNLHRRRWWRGSCRACGEVFPCQERQDAAAVLALYLPETSTRRPLRSYAAAVPPLLLTGAAAALASTIVRVGS